MALKMHRLISVKREHPADLMIQDVSTTTGTNSKSATSWEYCCLFKSSAALNVEAGFKMVEHCLLAENESVQVASQANALPPLKGKGITPSGLLPLPQSRPTVSRMEWRPAVSSDLFMMLLIAACRGNRPALKRHNSTWRPPCLDSNPTSTLVCKADFEADPRSNTDPKSYTDP